MRSTSETPWTRPERSWSRRWPIDRRSIFPSAGRGCVGRTANGGRRAAQPAATRRPDGHNGAYDTMTDTPRAPSDTHWKQPKSVAEAQERYHEVWEALQRIELQLSDTIR